MSWMARVPSSATWRTRQAVAVGPRSISCNLTMWTQMSNNWKLWNMAEIKRGSNLTLRIKMMHTNFAKQIRLEAYNQTQRFNLELIPVAAKAKNSESIQLSAKWSRVFFQFLGLKFGLRCEVLDLEFFKRGVRRELLSCVCTCKAYAYIHSFSRGGQDMSIGVLLACQWLFIDNSLNWVKQPSPRGSLTSSLRVRVCGLCVMRAMTT